MQDSATAQDRAAKAARAKDKLRKFQAQKRATAAANGTPTSPSSPPLSPVATTAVRPVSPAIEPPPSIARILEASKRAERSTAPSPPSAASTTPALDPAPPVAPAADSARGAAQSLGTAPTPRRPSPPPTLFDESVPAARRAFSPPLPAAAAAVDSTTTPNYSPLIRSIASPPPPRAAPPARSDTVSPTASVTSGTTTTSSSFFSLSKNAAHLFGGLAATARDGAVAAARRGLQQQQQQNPYYSPRGRGYEDESPARTSLDSRTDRHRVGSFDFEDDGAPESRLRSDADFPMSTTTTSESRPSRADDRSAFFSPSPPEVAQLAAERDSLQAHIRDLEAQLSESVDPRQVEGLRELVDRLEEEVSGFKAREEENDARRHDLERGVGLAREALQDANGQLAAKDVDLERLAAELAVARSATETAATEAAADRDRLNERAQRAEEEAARTAQELARLREERGDAVVESQREREAAVEQDRIEFEERLVRFERDARDERERERAARTEVERERDTVRTELEAERERVHALEAAVAAAETSAPEPSHTTKVNELEAELDELRQTLARRGEVLASTRQDRTDAEQVSLERQERIDALGGDLAALGDEPARCRSDLEKASTERESIREELNRYVSSHGAIVERLRDQVDQATREADELRDRAGDLGALQAQLDEAITARADAEKRLSERDGRMSDLEAELASTKDQLSTHTTRADHLQVQLAAAGSAQEELQKQLSTAQQQLSTVQQQLASAEQARDTASADETVSRADLQKSLDEALERGSSLQTKLKASEEQSAIRDENLATARRELALLQEQYATLEKASREARSVDEEMVESLRKELSNVQQEAEGLRQQVRESTDRIAKLEEDAAAVRDEADKLRQNLASLGDEAAAVHSQADELRRKLETAEANAASAETAVEQLRAETAAQQQRLERVQAELTAEQTRAVTADDALKLAQKDLDEARTQLDTLQEAKQSTLDELEKLRAEHNATPPSAPQDVERIAELEARVQRLEQATTSAGTETERLRSVEADLRKRVESGPATGTSIASSIAGLSRSSTPTLTNGNKLTELERDLQVFKDVLAASESRATGLQHSLDAAEKDLDDRESEILRLESLLEDAAAKERELETDMAALAAKVAEHASRNTELQSQVDRSKSFAAAPLEPNGHKAEVEKLEAALATAEGDLAGAQQARQAAEDDLRAQLDQLRTELKSRTVEAEAAAARSTGLATELEAARAEIARLETAHIEAQRQHDDLAITHSSLRSELDAFTSSDTSTAEEIAALKASLATAADSEASAQQQLASLHNELSRLETAKREVDEELAQCRGEVEETSATLSAAMAELDSTKDEVVELEKSVEDLRIKLRRAQEGRLASEQEIKAIEERLADAVRSKEVAESEPVTLRQGAESASPAGLGPPELDERERAELEALRQELEVERARFAEASRALVDVREMHSKARQEVERLHAIATGPANEASPSTNGKSDQSADEASDALRLQISEAQAKIRQLEQDVFTLESTRLKMLKANGDLKSQVESMMDALAQERTRARMQQADAESSTQYDHPSASTANRSQPSPGSARVPQGDFPAPPLTPSRRGHVHRRTASTLAPVSEVSDSSHETATGYQVEAGLDEAGEELAGVDPLTPLGSPPIVTAINTPAASVAPTPMLPRSSTMGDRLPDAAATPASRKDHVRRASLSLLKARMEEEFGVPDLDKAGPLSPVGRGPSPGGASDGPRTHRVPLSRDLVCARFRMALFVDRYRPRSLDDLDYHPELSSRLRALAAGDFPHTLFYGPSGAGKKTRIMATLRELFGPGVEKLRIEQRTFLTPSKRKLDVNIVQSNYHIEITPSDLGNYDRAVVQEVLKDIAQTQQVDLNARKRFKVVIINEADGMSRDAQSALRRTMEKFTSSLRVILCANSTSKIIGPIRSRCLLLRVGAPTEEQINGVVQKVAAAENIAIPDHVSLLLSRISLGNLRRAILSFEALYAQDPAFKSVKPDHSLLTTGKQDARDIDAVPRPDWEKYAAKTAEKIMSDQKPETLLEVRGMFYELLVHCIPAQLILATVTRRLLERVDEDLKADVAYWAAFYDHRLKQGNKHIFHLEAYAAKIMLIQKQHSLGFTE
ncbi:hypothetical protein BMF94_2797 [Rhodotorula taiwanensis]|uniref:Replication factor C subunit 5 n=1 Tax=Rhodotorula taiwanensis TaxID=741276 RepID=A0A2S5BB32_9BASI|nr:hypothetical protein BMF94_2797 [Rhodotorula taiwanensis]